MNASATSHSAPSALSAWLDVLALAQWPAALALGIIGFLGSYDRPAAPAAKPELPPVELLEVELGDPMPAAPDSQPSAPPETLALPDLIPPPPDAPLATPVADPARVAFALPVEGPTVLVDASLAARAAPPPAPDAVAGHALPVETLVFGRGEGRQPAPRYPRIAHRAGQEGAVTVQFIIGPDGRVQDAAVSKPSPWPLLNDEALRVIERHWRFPRGQVRRFEVTLRFELTN